MVGRTCVVPFTDDLRPWSSALPDKCRKLRRWRSGVLLLVGGWFDVYLSVLCISLLIISPFLLKNYKLFSNIIGPVLALFILGYICRQSDALSGVENWNGLFYKGFLRGIAELLLGGFCFNISNKLKTVPFRKWIKGILTLVEISGYGIVLIYVASKAVRWYDFPILWILCVSITLTLSGCTFTSCVSLLPKWSKYIRSMSLAMYTCQVGCGMLVEWFYPTSETLYKLTFYILALIIASITCIFICDKLSFKKFKKYFVLE